MSVLKTSPYGIGYNDWTGNTYPNLEYVSVDQSGTADLHSSVSWPNYGADEFTRIGGSYTSSKNFAKLPYDLFRLEKGTDHVDVSATDFDPDGSAADIGPFGGPKANKWDVDGDGHYAHWQPGTEPSGELDCNDFDPTIGPGDC